jgi:transposase
MKKNNSNGGQHNVMTSTAEKATDQGKEKFAFYIGIDLGDKHCDVCVLNGEGEFEESFRLRMPGSDLQKRSAGIPRSRVAVEAGGQSRWLAELLEGCGHQVYVSNTRKVPTSRKATTRTIRETPRENGPNKP